MRKRKYGKKDSPELGGAIEFLTELSETLHKMGSTGLAELSQIWSDKLYDYLVRRMQRKTCRNAAEKSARNLTICLRGYQKRIAELEEKLLLIRTSTDLFDRGVRVSEGPGGTQIRMKRRIDHLEAKLLIIRDLTATSTQREIEPKSKVGAPGRKVDESRVRQGVFHHGLSREGKERRKAVLESNPEQ